MTDPRIDNWYVKDIYSNEYIDTKREIKQSSIINIPFEKTNIAFTLTKPHSNGISGGYRTLLKYINFLNQKGHYLDIYLGEIWIDKNIEQNLNDNVYGTPSCENWFKEDIKYYLVFLTCIWNFIMISSYWLISHLNECKIQD